MPHGYRMFAARDWVALAAAFAIGPAFVGGTVAFITGWDALQQTGGVASWLAGSGVRLLYTPFVAIVISPVVLAALALLMRYGVAGWAVVAALAAAPAIASLASSPDDAMFVLVAGWLHAGFLWAAAYGTEPDAFSRPP